MKTKKILFVLTSNGILGESGEPTGWWVNEAAHPWKVLTQAGYDIDFVSPLGGQPPVTGRDMKDPISKEFMENSTVKRKTLNTLKPSEVNVDDYCAIHFVGGHGTMWDLPECAELSKITAKLWEQNKVVSAVCHGPAGLLNVKLKGGDYLVKGKDLTCFTDSEEKAANMCEVIPYFLQCELMMRGAKFHIGKNGVDNVQVHERLITGQNPQSAMSLGKAVLTMLQHLGW